MTVLREADRSTARPQKRRLSTISTDLSTDGSLFGTSETRPASPARAIASAEWERRVAAGDPIQIKFPAVVAAATRLIKAGWPEDTIRAVFAATRNFSTAELNATRNRIEGRGTVALRPARLEQVISELTEHRQDVLARALGTGVGEAFTASFDALRAAQVAHSDPFAVLAAWTTPKTPSGRLPEG